MASKSKNKGPSARAVRSAGEENVRDWLVEAAQKERERQGLSRNRVVALAATRERLFLEQFEEVCEQYVGGTAQPKGYALKRPGKPCPRVLNLLLSDLHFGSAFDPSEVLKRFDAHVESRRIAWIALQAAEYKRDHRAETELHVHIIGDVIQGQLHDMRDGEPQAQQVLAAMQYLGQTISFLAEHFPKVTVRCTPGNHGRNRVRHQDRATLQKWDAIETGIYAGARAWTRTLKNTEWHIPKTPFFTPDYWGSSPSSRTATRSSTPATRTRASTSGACRRRLTISTVSSTPAAATTWWPWGTCTPPPSPTSPMARC